MTLTSTAKASIAAACMLAFAGCTDLKPMQAQIEELQSQVGKLQSDAAKAAKEAAAAKAQAAAATAKAQNAADQALANSQSNAMGIQAINDKIDQMFHKTLSK
jgi:F0F1-type ATP synthase membrane subunit b/b'